MNERRKFLYWTIVAGLALLFFYTFNASRVHDIWIEGDENFRKSVIRALGAEHVRFRISKDASTIFSQRDMTFTYKGSVYHLFWKSSDVEDALMNAECASCELIPIVSGTLDFDYFHIFKECAKIIKGRSSLIFENGWLMSKIGIIDGDRILMIYDPVTKTHEKVGGE